MNRHTARPELVEGRTANEETVSHKEDKREVACLSYLDFGDSLLFKTLNLKFRI